MTREEQKFSQNLDAVLGQIASQLATAIVDNEAPNSALLPKDVRKEQLKIALDSRLLLIKTRLENGATTLLKALSDYANTHPEIKMKEMGQELAKLLQYLMDLPDHLQEYLEGITQNKSLQELSTMQDTTLNTLYLSVKALYDEKHYQESADAFALLTLINPKLYALWMGLGNSELFCKHFDNALTAYAMAFHLNPLDHNCHLLSAKCYEALGDKDNAINALDLALKVIEKDKNAEKIRKQVLEKRARLLNK